MQPRLPATEGNNENALPKSEKQSKLTDDANSKDVKPEIQLDKEINKTLRKGKYSNLLLLWKNKYMIYKKKRLA